VDRPEGSRFRAHRNDAFLSWNLGLKEYDIDNPKERLRLYREFVYARGGVDTWKGKILNAVPCPNAWSASFSAPASSPRPGS
jgi:hypothetical protein